MKQTLSILILMAFTGVAIGQTTTEEYNYLTRGLVDVIEKGVAISVIVKSDISGKTYYLCIPIANPELHSRYVADVQKWDLTMQSNYAQLLGRYIAQLAFDNPTTLSHKTVPPDTVTKN